MLNMLNLAVAFLLELAMLAAFFYWGFQTGGSTLVRVLLGVGAPMIAIVIWARFMAPKSAGRLTGAAYLAVKAALFGLAALALAAAGQAAWAAVFAVVAVANEIWFMAAGEQKH